MLNKGGDINTRGSIYGYNNSTPLHVAAHCGYVNCVELLLDKGSRIKARSYYGNTALHYSVEGGHLQCIELLVNRECDVRATNNDWWTILHCAAFYGRNECIEKIIDLGVDINARNRKRDTAYDLATKRSNTDTAELIQRLSAARGQPPTT